MESPIPGGPTMATKTRTEKKPNPCQINPKCYVYIHESRKPKANDMTQTIPAPHPLAINLNFDAIMEASVHIPRSGTLRVPATPLQDLSACAVFFHPGSDEVEQGFYLVTDPRGGDTHHCITWDIEQWAGLSVAYDADEHLASCLVKWPGEPDLASFFDFSEAELEVSEGSIISIPSDDMIVVIGEDIDFQAGPERARALVTALAEVFVANHEGGAQ